MQQHGHYPLLDAGRGIAAGIIVCYHLKLLFAPDLLLPSYLGVDLFFIMSGLVVARAYETKLLNGALSFKSFCIIRLIRLWPLYLACTCIGFAYFPLRAILNPAESFDLIYIPTFLLNLFFIPSVLTAHENVLYSFNHPTWSLGFELLINIFYAAYAVRFSTKTLIALTLLGAVLLLQPSLFYNSIDMGWSWSTALGGFPRITFSFTLGVIFYRLLHRIPITLPAPTAYVLLIGMVLALCVPTSVPRLYYDWLYLLFIAPTFVVLACITPTPHCLLPTCRYLGRLSYALYTLHIPLIYWLAGTYKVATGVPLEQHPILTGGLMFVVILFFSHLAMILYDEPIRSKLRAYFASRHTI